jgi:RNA polymerase Rpb2, domain 6/RNA polymerase Rpb2, domain 7
MLNTSDKSILTRAHGPKHLTQRFLHPKITKCDLHFYNFKQNPEQKVSVPSPTYVGEDAPFKSKGASSPNSFAGASAGARKKNVWNVHPSLLGERNVRNFGHIMPEVHTHSEGVSSNKASLVFTSTNLSVGKDARSAYSLQGSEVSRRAHLPSPTDKLVGDVRKMPHSGILRTSMGLGLPQAHQSELGKTNDPLSCLPTSVGKEDAPFKSKGASTPVGKQGHNKRLNRQIFNLESYHRSNQDTCLRQKPVLKEGDWVQTGDLLADSASSMGGELALGHNIIVAYMPWEGYNYEDSILINERLVYEDIYTSIHIERYEVTTKETKLGSEQITREIPDISENLISHLDKNGIAKIGSWVEEGDILVGKVAPFNVKSLTPQQKLLYKIFNKQLSNIKDSSFRAPKGIKANVIKVNILAHQKQEVFTKGSAQKLTGQPKKKSKKSKKAQTVGKPTKIPKSTPQSNNKQPSLVHVYLAEKRKIRVGDKMAGRHGNKGIVSLILPRQDMPFLPDGTPVDIVLNPLGVPSRMNVGQIYECLLGLAGRYLGEHYKIPPFDEVYGADASRSFVLSKLYEARKKTGLKWLFDPHHPGKMRLFDGRNSEVFYQAVTIGVAYVLKLVHMVDDKMHARSTGPYSLITQQPLRGRSKQGGQRLGEMEVWAIEGYGAAFVLSEMLTLKSDDMTGRQNLWKNLISHKPISLGSPESFKVLICELQALCLDIGLFRKNPVHSLPGGQVSSLSNEGTKPNLIESGSGAMSQSASSMLQIDSLLHLA